MYSYECGKSNRNKLVVVISRLEYMLLVDWNIEFLEFDYLIYLEFYLILKFFIILSNINITYSMRDSFIFQNPRYNIIMYSILNLEY